MSIAIAMAAVLVILLPQTSVSAGDAACGPFGDAPAQVQHGLLANFVTDHSPICVSGVVLGPWQDPGGSQRYACLYEPESASAPLPLVVFLHGSLATADSIVVTGLTKQVDKADLGGSRPGFILIAPEGRDTTHYYPGPDAKAKGWDNWYRQLAPSGSVTVGGTAYEENVDAAAIDHFISQELATGKVDRKRIYLMGWSNGAAMAALYALNHPDVAAAAIYSAPDPFGAFDDRCPQTPVAHPPVNNSEIQLANPRVPILHIRNSCDIGGICPNGIKFTKELQSLGDNIQDIILDASGNQVSGCDDSCGTDRMAGGSIGLWGETRGLKNHVMWPRHWNGRMFDFLKQHLLANAQ